MTQHTSTSAQEIEAILAELPADKVQEVVDFASYLRHRYGSTPKRGSARAILQALETTGPLEFEKGELETLLEELETMRQIDLHDNG